MHTHSTQYRLFHVCVCGCVEGGMLQYVGWTLWVMGLLMESVADRQKDAFKSIKGNEKKLMTQGLFAYVRFPNYAVTKSHALVSRKCMAMMLECMCMCTLCICTGRDTTVVWSVSRMCKCAAWVHTRTLLSHHITHIAHRHSAPTRTTAFATLTCTLTMHIAFQHACVSHI